MIPTDVIQRFEFDFQDVLEWDKDIGFRVGLYNSRSKPTSYDLLDAADIKAWKPEEKRVTINDYDMFRDEVIGKLKAREVGAKKTIRGNIADLAAFWTPFFKWPQFEGQSLTIDAVRVKLGSDMGGDVVRLKADDEAPKNPIVMALLPADPRKNAVVKNLRKEFGSSQISKMGAKIKELCGDVVKA